MNSGGKTFVLRLRPGPGCNDPVHALRRALKYALRQCGLRCVAAHEETVPVQDFPTAEIRPRAEIVPAVPATWGPKEAPQNEH